MIMLELEFNGYYRLTAEHLDMYVPSRPGIYILAVRLVNGVHQTFFTSQSDNLYSSLKRLSSKNFSAVPSNIKEYMERYQCYFTYYVILNIEYLHEIEKMINETSDPVLKLRIIESN
jgi:hypothetical protein